MTHPTDKLSPVERRLAKVFATIAVDEILGDSKSGLSESDHKKLRERNRRLKEEIRINRASETA